MVIELIRSKAKNENYSRPSKGQASADAIPILIDDTYHLFHLTTPPYTVHHPPRLRSSWLRIRSTDLESWTRDSVHAIAPGSHPQDPDADGAWTGSALIGPDGNLQIFYTGYNLAHGGRQIILRALGSDRHGSKFRKLAEPLFIDPKTSARGAFEDIDFRDAYVFFNEQVSEYWMIVGTRLSNGPRWTRGCLALLTSLDLEKWTLHREPLYAPNDMYCPECPELFSLPNGKWYLFYSRFASPDAGTVYRIADSPYGPFRVPRDGSHGRLDGRRWYAAKSCPKAGDPSKRIFFGWTGDYNVEDGKWLWGGDMALPRQVSANLDHTLRMDPLEKSTKICTNLLDDLNGLGGSSTLELAAIGTTKTHPLRSCHGAETSMNYLEFSIEKCEAASFGILFCYDSDMRGHKIFFVPDTNETLTLILRTDLPPLDDFWADQYSLHLPRGVDGPDIVRHDHVKIQGQAQLFMEGDLLHFFFGGRAMTYRMPPRKGGVTAQSSEGIRNGEMNGVTRADSGRKQDHCSETTFAFFVEDGEVSLSNIRFR
ncbi:hypothetical protein H2204_003777 [Knufia peltigerae]|uniref:beta-fructofuranosidase n=1 Tax=Knufia peltigerae TaxID=1002370 RepID=A0AA39D1F3_9EURO|nr:hypothetical protein H2204_003777 [Knufia peltigerae]